MPQIEVTFDVDANGIIHVNAKDKSTGKENTITIKANSGLSDEEIEKMVRDAKSHEAEDRKIKELIETRNLADNVIYSAEKSNAENEDVKKAIEELKVVAKSDNISDIKQKIEKLQSVVAQAQQTASSSTSTNNDDDDVIDADFTEKK